MKGNIGALLQALREERTRLENENAELEDLKKRRMDAARRCLVELIPNLSDGALGTLSDLVPGFPIPTVPAGRFLGISLGKKLDPKMTVDSLRIQLGTYLDNASGTVPELWEQAVGMLDGEILALQEDVPDTTTALEEIDKRIGAMERLMKADLNKMKPQVRHRLEQALAAQVNLNRHSARPYRNLSLISEPVSYPSRHEIDSDSGPDLLTMYLWYELLFGNTSSSDELDRIDPGGGDFGGAGGGDDNPGDQNKTPGTYQDVPIEAEQEALAGSQTS